MWILGYDWFILNSMLWGNIPMEAWNGTMMSSFLLGIFCWFLVAVGAAAVLGTLISIITILILRRFY